MTLVLRNALLVDAVHAEPLPNQSVLIEGERITDITSKPPFRMEDAQVIDLQGMTLLPGLIDAHAHLGLVEFNTSTDPGAVSAAELASWIFENCELCLETGFTTVRDMCGVDGGVGRAIASGAVRGPRVFPSGPAIVQTGGHGHLAGPFCHADYPLDIPGLVQMLAICDGPDAVRKQARTNFRRGATQLKAFISGGVVSTTDRMEDTQLTVEELRAAVEEARARDTYVSGHAHNVRAIRNGLEAGLECFEHGTMLDEATARAMAKAGAALDPTLTVCHLMAQDWKQWGLPESVVPRVAGCETAMAESIKMAHAAGVLIGSGSDLLGRRQNRRGLELALKAKILSPMQALVCATLNNARIIRQDKHLGSIEQNKLADMIVIDGDPLATPELFDDPDKIVLVVKGGTIVKNSLEGRNTSSRDGEKGRLEAAAVV